MIQAKSLSTNQKLKFSGTGFQPVHVHRQDAGVTKNFPEQSRMGLSAHA
jgi:hypothetical protein